MAIYEISHKCKRCGLCRKNCQNEAILGEKKQHHEILPNKCRQCGTCFINCPFGAISKDGVMGIPKKARKTVLKARINSQECIGCRNCYLNCPNEVISFKKKFFGSGHCVVDTDNCVGCGTCMTICINKCITLEEHTLPTKAKPKPKPKPKKVAKPEVPPPVEAQGGAKRIPA